MFIIVNSENEKMNFTSNDEWVVDEIDYLEFESFNEADDYLRIYDGNDEFNVCTEEALGDQGDIDDGLRNSLGYPHVTR